MYRCIHTSVMLHFERGIILRVLSTQLSTGAAAFGTQGRNQGGTGAMAPP